MKIFCTLGLIVAVAFLAVEGHNMDLCVDNKKFIAFASQAEGCQNLGATKPDADGGNDRSDSSQGSPEDMGEKIKMFMKDVTCFFAAGKIVDPATNETDVDLFKAALKEITINDDISGKLNDEFDNCNESKATKLKEDSKKVFKCFFKKMRKICKEKEKDDKN